MPSVSEEQEQRAARTAYQIAASILGDQVENGCDGNPLIELAAREGEPFYDLVIAHLEAIVRSLKAKASGTAQLPLVQASRYPEGVEGTQIDQSQIGWFGLDWLMDRRAQIVWSSPAVWIGRQGVVTEGGQGHDGRYAVRVKLDAVAGDGEWFGLDQIRVLPVSAPPAESTPAAPSAGGAWMPRGAIVTGPRHTDPPWAHGVHGSQLMGASSLPEWLIGRQVLVDAAGLTPGASDGQAAWAGQRGPVVAVAGTQGGWNVRVNFPAGARWFDLHHLHVLPVSEPSAAAEGAEADAIPPSAPGGIITLPGDGPLARLRMRDTSAAPYAYVWPEGKPPVAGPGQIIEIISGDVEGATGRGLVIRVRRYRVVDAPSAGEGKAQ